MASSEMAANDTTSVTYMNEQQIPLDDQVTSIQGKTAEQFTSSSDGQSDEDEELDDFPAQEGQSFIGVSISAEQTRLASPTTPAAEKAAAIGDDDLFVAALERRKQQLQQPFTFTGKEFNKPRPSTTGDGIRMEQIGADTTSLTTYSQSKQPQQPNGLVTSALKNVVGGRPRASSGPLATVPERNPKRLFPISLPSLPKFSGSNRLSFSALSFLRHPIAHYESTTSSSHNKNSNSRNEDFERSSIRNEIDSRTEQKSRSTKAPPLLRRSTSDGSLYLLRAKSQASSLGDDSRFQNVHEQVNSRAKAIRDSIVDANIRLPRLKSHWFELHSSNKSGPVDSSIGASTATRDFGQVQSHGGDLMKPQIPDNNESSTVLIRGSARPGVSPRSHFSKALRNLTGDLVILGGYRGSILRSADPPHRQLWVPLKVGLGVRKVNLEVGLEPEDEDNMPASIFASGMLKNIGPVDISKRLFKRLMDSENVRNGTLRVHDYGYDWRLSPELLSRQLQKFLETLPSNQNAESGARKGALVIAHSLGGLIARHAINATLQDNKDLVSGIIYAGVPQTCVNILGPLRNGDDVFLSSKVLTAQVNFTIRTSYALLPLDGACFFDKDTKEEYRVDFFDPKTWEENCLSPCIARPLPPKPLKDEPQGMVDQLLQTVANALPSVSILKPAVPDREANGTQEWPRLANTDDKLRDLSSEPGLTGQNPLSGKLDHSSNPQEYGKSEETVAATAVTFKKEEAMKYLTRTLRDVKKFKEELAFDERLAEGYPPAAVIFGKSIPTVSGASVCGREGIKRTDAYDSLSFASGDGVVLARASQIPDGYHVVKGGVVSSDRGHISLLGDLEAVGQCINAIMSDQRRRIKCQAVQGWSDNYNEEQKHL